MIGLFLQLFWTFFIIGMFTFGGGYAVIGIIQSEIVVAKGWVTESAFTDIVAISQMTPGPVGLNCSTYVGYEVLKEAGASEAVSCLGSLTASLAIVLPSFIIVLALVRFYARFHETGTFRSVLGALKPVVAGLIGASALALTLSIHLGDGISLANCIHLGSSTLEGETLGGSIGALKGGSDSDLGFSISVITENFPDWKAWVLFAAALGAYLSGRIGPVTILAAGALLGALLY